MPTELHPFTDFHKAGYLYLLVCWVLFLGYAALYQADQLMRLGLRWRRQWRCRTEYAKGDESIRTPLAIINHWLRPLEHSLTIPYVATMISIKHLIGMTLFTLANVIFTWFAPFKLHPAVKHYEWPVTGILDRRMMYIGMANFSFTMVLGTRNSIVTALCGLTFEQLIPFHRWCARMALAETVLHVVYRIWEGYWTNGGSFYDAFFLDEEYTSGTLSTVGYVIIFATSVYYIRRHLFRLFYYAHIIGIVIATGGAMWHEWSCIYFFYPPTALWLLDRLLRSYRSWCQRCELLSVAQSHEKIVHAKFTHPGLRHFYPGQYFFAAFQTHHGSANKGSSQTMAVTKRWYTGVREWVEQHADWYPMTVSEVTDDNSNDKTASLHIKALGDGTRQLMQSVRDCSPMIDMRVDGPYGPRLQYMDYNTVALFAVGIGITPALPILKDCIQQMTRRSSVRRLYLVWSVTTAEEVDPFIEYLEACSAYPSSDVHVNISIHLTREQDIGRCHQLAQKIPGTTVIDGRRPDIHQYLGQIADEVPKCKRVWVHACGSVPFMNTVINEAVRHGFDFHHETFDF